MTSFPKHVSVKAASSLTFHPRSLQTISDQLSQKKGCNGEGKGIWACLAHEQPESEEKPDRATKRLCKLVEMVASWGQNEEQWTSG